MRHPSTVLQRGRADTATLINNEGTRQIVLIWKLVFCFLFLFWMTPTSSLKTNAQLQVGKHFSAGANTKTQSWWACTRSGPLHPGPLLGIPEGSSFSQTPTCLHLSAGNKSLSFFLMGCDMALTLFLNIESRKKTRAVNNYILDPGPVAMTVMTTLHSDVLRYNSYLKIYCSATPTWPACCRSG